MFYILRLFKSARHVLATQGHPGSLANPRTFTTSELLSKLCDNYLTLVMNNIIIAETLNRAQRSRSVKMIQLNNTPRFTIENNILKGKEVAYPDDYASLGKFILDSLEKDLDSVGQVDAVTDEVYTYGKMRERSVRCALWMRSQGLLPRDVVLVCSNDHLDFATPGFAALYLGAILSPCDVTLDADNLRHCMKITKPKMVFASESSAAAISEAAKEARLNLKIIVFGRVLGFFEFESVIAEPGIEDVEKFECTAIESLEEIAWILFSSGSSGSSKGAALSHRALNMRLCPSEASGMAGNVRLTFAATHWNTAIEPIFMNVLLQIPRIILPPFEENLACAMIEKHRASQIFLTPHMIDRLVKYATISSYDLSSLTTVVHSGSPLHAASYEALVKLLPKAQISTRYGITESGGCVSIQSTGSQLGSCGKIIENGQLKVIDPDTGRTLGPNQKGELLVKTASMMSFYYGDPQATAKAIDEEGWLHSGDLGYYDEDGEIFLIDRLKDIIRCEYHDICPSEIESVISSHPGVKEVAVVGQPRDQDDDLLIAFVVRAKDLSDTSEQVLEIEIVNLVAAELPEIMQLRAGVRFIDQIPKTSTNKVRRAALRDLVRSRVKI